MSRLTWVNSSQVLTHLLINKSENLESTQVLLDMSQKIWTLQVVKRFFQLRRRRGQRQDWRGVLVPTLIWTHTHTEKPQDGRKEEVSAHGELTLDFLSFTGWGWWLDTWVVLIFVCEFLAALPILSNSHLSKQNGQRNTQPRYPTTPAPTPTL